MDTKSRLIKTDTLDRVAGSGLGVDGAIGPAQPAAAEDLARVL